MIMSRVHTVEKHRSDWAATERNAAATNTTKGVAHTADFLMDMVWNEREMRAKVYAFKRG